MEENKWMIVKKEKITTKIKNYFKNIFSKMLNNSKKKANTERTVKQENVYIYQEKEIHRNNIQEAPKKTNKEITIELVEKKRRPKEITIEYEANKKKQIVVEYEQKTKKDKQQQRVPSNNIEKQQNRKVIQVEVNRRNSKPQLQQENKKREGNRTQKTFEKRENRINFNSIKSKKIEEENSHNIIKNKKIKLEQEITQELSLKPVKVKKEKKPFNIFQLFKDKERKKRKEILNRLRENKADDYETISTKTKLSKGTIAVEDVDANELDPLIDLYRDSNKKLRNRIISSQQ